MRRPGPRLIAIRAVDALKVYVPFMLLQGGFAQRLPEVLQVPWAVFVWLYSLSRVPAIFLDWLTIRCDVGPQGITYRAGWPSRTLTRVRWSEVDTLGVEQDAINRLLRVHRVTVSLGADSRPAIVLEAVTDDEVARWRAWFEHATESGSAGHTATAPDEVVSRVGAVDLAVISVTYGQWVLVVPFLVSTYYEMASWFPLPAERSILAGLAQSPGWTLVGAVVVAAVYGWARAWLRYGGHRVDRVGDAYEIRHRAVDHSVRRVRSVEVAGLRIDQNPLMRLLGLGSLHLVLRGSQSAGPRLTVLPVAPMSVVERHARALLPQSRPPGRRVNCGAAAVVGVPLMGVAALLWAAGHAWPAGLTGLVALWGINRSCAAVSTGVHCPIVFTRGLWSRRIYELGPGGLRSLSGWAWGQGRRVMAGTVLDRSPVTLLAAGVAADDWHRLRAHLRGI